MYFFFGILFTAPFYFLLGQYFKLPPSRHIRFAPRIKSLFHVLMLPLTSTRHRVAFFLGGSLYIHHDFTLVMGRKLAQC